MQTLTINSEDGATLDSLLRELPPPPDRYRKTVQALPVSHLTSARSFETIIDSGKLEARLCKVFNQKLLYFSYGGIFHRYGSRPTNNAAEYPIAILFSPRLLSKIKFFYPYDTGAASENKYGDRWSQELACFEKYRVLIDPRADLLTKLVYYTYGNNKSYVGRRGVSSTATRRRIDRAEGREPLRTLITFMSANLTSEGADHRQNVIECQAQASLGIGDVFKEIEWIGYPNNKRKSIYEFISRFKEPLDRMPETYAYDAYLKQPPYAISRELESVARTVVKRYWENQGGKI
jgi:hypothetical protein